MNRYFATYETFYATSKKDAAVLLSADNLIGDVYDISIELAEGNHRAWLINRFNQRIGFFGSAFSRTLSVQRASGLTLKAVLSFVAYTTAEAAGTEAPEEKREPENLRRSSLNSGGSHRSHADFLEKGSLTESGGYWGEMAVLCFDPAEDESFGRFLQGVSERIRDGVRPRIDLDEEGVRRILDNKGDWLPKQTVPPPASIEGTSILKDHLSLSDKMIEQGRSKNPGCYVLSWAFILATVGGIALLLKALLPL